MLHGTDFTRSHFASWCDEPAHPGDVAVNIGSVSVCGNICNRRPDVCCRRIVFASVNGVTSSVGRLKLTLHLHVESFARSKNQQQDQPVYTTAPSLQFQSPTLYTQ